ncbi:hypothetical protein PV08_03893 [Exophiala spinifera]|uniref:DNA2/NAM7 helicase-like C-terminal domain-containing protein n=1 Tax=Exophiala spinifera TaxID=91928 RepID=A0A0D2BZF6_9EURO|nr:uncharacterized protein PV08_03893 [Exophiala spinifera]KIW16704.1 hypothetical protein PV08_03893 [Exophiala spinifera]
MGNLVYSCQKEPVMLVHVPEVHPSKRLLKALESVRKPPAERPSTAWTDQGMILMTANTLGNFSSEENFDTVASEGDPLVLMELNQSQKEHYEPFSANPCKVMLILGCSGSGKNHMIQQIVKPFFRSNKRHRITPTRSFSSSRPNTEESIRNHVFIDDRRKPNGRPEIEDCDPAEISGLDLAARRHFDSGRFFIWYIGIVRHPEYTHPNADEHFADLRHRSRRYWTDEEMDKEAKAAYKADLGGVFMEIFRQPSALITPTFAGSSPFIEKAIGNHVAGVILDEAASERDDNWYPTLVQDLLKIKARLPGTPHPTNAVLPAYSAQRDRCINMKAFMELDRLDGVDRLTVATIDAVQGEEDEFVSLILPILRGPDFLQDPRRMNVGTSGARHGLVVILVS